MNASAFPPRAQQPCHSLFDFRPGLRPIHCAATFSLSWCSSAAAPFTSDPASRPHSLPLRGCLLPIGVQHIYPRLFTFAAIYKNSVVLLLGRHLFTMATKRAPESPIDSEPAFKKVCRTLSPSFQPDTTGMCPLLVFQIGSLVLMLPSCRGGASGAVVPRRSFCSRYKRCFSSFDEAQSTPFGEDDKVWQTKCCLGTRVRYGEQRCLQEQGFI